MVMHMFSTNKKKCVKNTLPVKKKVICYLNPKKLLLCEE
jgi:hypothetical protein